MEKYSDLGTWYKRVFSMCESFGIPWQTRGTVNSVALHCGLYCQHKSSICIFHYCQSSSKIHLHCKIKQISLLSGMCSPML